MNGTSTEIEGLLGLEELVGNEGMVGCDGEPAGDGKPLGPGKPLGEGMLWGDEELSALLEVQDPEGTSEAPSMAHNMDSILQTMDKGILLETDLVC